MGIQNRLYEVDMELPAKAAFFPKALGRSGSSLRQLCQALLVLWPGPYILLFSQSLLLQISDSLFLLGQADDISPHLHDPGSSP